MAARENVFYKMELPSWMKENLNISFLALDIALIVLTEIVFNLAVRTSRHHKQRTLLSFQLLFLIFVTVFVNALHHVPYVLLVCDVMIAARIVLAPCFLRRTSKYQSKVLTHANHVSGQEPSMDTTHIYGPRHNYTFPTSSNQNKYPSLLPDHHRNSQFTTTHHQQMAAGTVTVPSVNLPYRSQTKPHGLSLQRTALGTIHTRQPNFQSPENYFHPKKLSPAASAPKEAPSPLHIAASSYFPTSHMMSSPGTYKQASIRPLFSKQPFSYPSNSLVSPQNSSSTPPGLFNAGNTCFLNSIIQCLACSDFKLLEILNNIAPAKSLSEVQSLLVQALLAVFKQCSNLQNKPVDTTPLLNSVSLLAPHLVASRDASGSSYNYQSQQDAAEFLLWLLDTLHSACKAAHESRDPHEYEEERAMEVKLLEERKMQLLKLVEEMKSDNPSSHEPLKELSEVDRKLYKLNDYSLIHDLCYGQLVEARECQQCHRVSVNLEYFAILPLPVPVTTATVDLGHCFRLFSEVEELTRDSNMLHCLCGLYRSQDSCTKRAKLTPGRRLALLGKLPDKLVLQLTRFSYDIQNKTTLKNQSPIRVPVTGLDLTPYTLSGKLHGADEPVGPVVYDLTGLCVHTGAHAATHGHYIAYSRGSSSSWYSFNDDYVNPITSMDHELSQSFVLQNAYLLFYSRRN